MEAKIIRGYKLKLWKDRLNLAPEFIDQINLTSFNYVHLEQPIGDNVTVVLFTKLQGKESVIPVIMTIPKEAYDSIVERIEVKK